jgi:hypothetical protein
MNPKRRAAAVVLFLAVVCLLIGAVWRATPDAQVLRRQQPPPIRRVLPDRQVPPRLAPAVTQPVPIVIKAGPIQRRMSLRTDSPYYAAQFASNTALPLTVIEADFWGSFYEAFSPDNKGAPRVGVDQRTIIVPPDAATVLTNFRYSTGERNLKGMLFQVSRLPFANDPAHWNRVSGLVATGSLFNERTDIEGFHYFQINMARVANQKLGARPYFEGTAERDTASAVGPPLPPPKIGPGSGRGGELVRLKPDGIRIVPGGLRTRTPKVPPKIGGGPPAEGPAVDQDKTYYVRLVPLRAGGGAGVPSIPVEITVHRPRPCPPSSANLVVSPPSARVAWYMRPVFWDSSDAGGRWFVAIGSRFYPQGAHMKDPAPKPDDKSWWEKMVDAFSSAINYLSDMMTGMSLALDTLEDMFVEFHAKVLSYAVTGGLFRCDESDACKGVLKAGLQATMSVYGIPPTLPTGPELMSLSKEYLVELGADTLGAGELYDAYQALPSEVKNGIKAGGRSITEDFVQSQSDGRQKAYEDYLCYQVPDPMSMTIPKAMKTECRNRIPDPIFNSAHPATVLVWVENPNSTPTQRMSMSVRDSMGLYETGEALVPSLEPGQGLSIPVLLKENTRQFMAHNGGTCPSKEDAITISGEFSCQMKKWLAQFNQSDFSDVAKSMDTFSVSFATGQGAAYVGGITEASAGKSLQSIISTDPERSGCVTSRKIEFPSGWMMTTRSRAVRPDAWDNMFAGGGPDGNPNGGMLRDR